MEDLVMRVTAIAAFCAVLPWIVPALAIDIEAEAEKIEGKLMSPCCMTNTVAVHESGASYKIRREIREMLAAGRTEAEIIDVYVEEHGPQILAIPEAKGFSLATYLFPVVFLILAGGGLAIAFRKWRKTDRDVALTAEPAAPTGPYAERLKRELERLD
jgi:cytochrome c-type biogenesis protein CcmH